MASWRRRWAVKGALEALDCIENSEKRKTFWVGRCCEQDMERCGKVHLGDPGVHTDVGRSFVKTILFSEVVYLC